MSCPLAILALLVPWTGAADPTDGATDESPPVAFTERQVKKIRTHTPIGPPPEDPTNAVADDPRAAALGQRLFFDPSLSRDGSISCATCHDPATGFTDGSEVAMGLGVGTRNTPTLWNAAYHRWLFWDGRADTLWAQALGPMETEHEMGGNRARIARYVLGEPELASRYGELFGPAPDLSDRGRFPDDARPIPRDAEHPHHLAWEAMDGADRETVDRVFSNVGKAIAAYERRLVSRRSPFDVFAEGLAEDDLEKQAALSEPARRGLAIFLGRGNCRLCHGGPNFSDGEFHRTGIPPLDGGKPLDSGRHGGARKVVADPFNAAGRFSDDPEGPRAALVRRLVLGPETWGEFRTPSLRNVALTAPYMHQGQLATLADVVRFYSTLEGALPAGHHQERILVPLELSETEQADLIAFLESLTDEAIEPELLAPPR